MVVVSHNKCLGGLTGKGSKLLIKRFWVRDPPGETLLKFSIPFLLSSISAKIIFIPFIIKLQKEGGKAKKKKKRKKKKISTWQDSNPRPADLKSNALPMS